MNKLKIAIVSPNYPSENSGGFGFVHARAKLYGENNNVHIFAFTGFNIKRIFEEINITEGNKSSLNDEILAFNPDVLAVHFPDFQIIHLVQNIDIPKVIWIHGHEILFSTRISSKPKNIIDSLIKRVFLFPRQIYQMLLLRSFLAKVNKVIFVSNWMRTSAEKSVFRKFHNAEVIPNPVDTNLFKYQDDIVNNIGKTVSIRGLQNTKYGIDLGIEAFANENEISFDIYGQGKLYSKYVDLIRRKKSNTRIFKVALQHSQIPSLLSKYSIFIAPSRVEAQGVSMCEAMSCGLPIVATNIGGIPEFVRNGIDGFLVEKENPEAIINAVKNLVSNPKKLIEYGKNARKNIERICSSDIICKQEIRILYNAARIRVLKA